MQRADVLVEYSHQKQGEKQERNQLKRAGKNLSTWTGPGRRKVLKRCHQAGGRGVGYPDLWGERQVSKEGKKERKRDNGGG